jgi:ferredoxin-NADP reductase
VRETRSYSPASSPLSPDGLLEFTVSTHPEGKVSRHLRDHAAPGTIVGLTPADGEFLLPEPRPERVLLISGGSGITPVMSMLRTLCEEEYGGEISFLNYARSPLYALYGAELAKLAKRNTHLRVARGYTRGRGGQVAGRFCLDHVRNVASRHADAATFVCGPPALIDGVRQVWAVEGMPAPSVETFTAPAFALDTDGATGTVSFTSAGRQTVNSGLPLLEPNHGCRMGICNTCSCTKASGTVRNILTGELSSAGEEQIRICVSVPVGDVALNL